MVNKQKLFVGVIVVIVLFVVILTINRNFMDKESTTNNKLTSERFVLNKGDTVSLSKFDITLVGVDTLPAQSLSDGRSTLPENTYLLDIAYPDATVSHVKLSGKSNPTLSVGGATITLQGEGGPDGLITIEVEMASPSPDVRVSPNAVKPQSENPSEEPGLPPNEDFDKMYDVTNVHISKRKTLIEGIEIWEVIRNLAQDPVQIESWIVTSKSKARKYSESISPALKDISFRPKSETDALHAAKLFVDDRLHTVVEKGNIATINVPEEVRAKLMIPKITQKGDVYVVDMDVFSYDNQAERFFGTDTRAVVRYHFEIGTSYIKQISYEELWMGNPPDQKEVKSGE